MDPAGFLAGFVLVTVLGVLTGMLTGLAPGIHVNNVAAFVLATETTWARFLGAIVGSMIIALYMPIFKIFDLIK